MTTRPRPMRSVRALTTRAVLPFALPALILTAVVGIVDARPVDAGIVPTVTMGTVANYSVLAASTVTNTNPSVFGESVGLSPGTSIVGFPPGVVLAPGTIEATSPVTLQAQNDLTIAYNDAAGRSVEFTQTNPDLVGQTLIPGVYAASAKAPLGLSGRLVLDGQGDPNAVFIFQTDSTLITSTGSTIDLINGASECNVFWQVGSSATLGSGSLFVGNILALTSVTVESAVVVHGRALARTGAVTLDNDTFTQPSCAPTATSATSTTGVPSPTPAPSAIGSTLTTEPMTTPASGGTAEVSDTAAPVDDILFSSTSPAFRSPSRTLPSTGGGPASAIAAGSAALALGAIGLTVRRRRTVSPPSR